MAHEIGVDPSPQKQRPLLEFLVVFVCTLVLILLSASIDDFCWNSTPDESNFFFFVTHNPDKYTDKFWYIYVAVVMQVSFLTWISIIFLYRIEPIKRVTLAKLVLLEIACGVGNWCQSKDVLAVVGCQIPPMGAVVQNLFAWHARCQIH